jgi:catechol 2,3-dioxygenase-like lactoylglutathione lyase family enzyme
VVEGLHHIALRVADLPRSAAFYGSVLGLAVLRRFEDEAGVRAVWLALGGGAILMLERELLPPGPPGGSGHVLALRVPDLGGAEERLAAAGVAVVTRTSWTLFVHDPDGHRVGLSTHPGVADAAAGAAGPTS